jgi:hypothetical protein
MPVLGLPTVFLVVAVLALLVGIGLALSIGNSHEPGRGLAATWAFGTGLGVALGAMTLRHILLYLRGIYLNTLKR